MCGENGSRVITKYEIAAISVAVLFGMAVGVVLGGIIGRDAFRKKAIAAGVAHWTVNPTNGETKFEWLMK